jgi:hypothetical protein
MTLKSLLAVALLAFGPGMAIAQGCNHEPVKISLKCTDGKVFDPAAQACVPVTG